MNTPRVNWHPAMTRRLVKNGVLRPSPFTLADVGVSGGIDRYWENFADHLRVFAFDGLIGEIERLRREEGGPNRRYFAALVGDKRPGDRSPAESSPPAPLPFARSSAVRAAEIARVDYTTTYYDPGGSGKVATETIALDDFFATHPADVDFLKIDTDGFDYPVLLGAEKLLTEGGVLGVAIESQFHGPEHPRANTFRNIDRFLHRAGFSLFDLEVYRYSRRALPKPFVYRIPAQTHAGQTLWGDALYLRDLAAKPQAPIPPAKIVKLACLFEIFGLEDCAAELLDVWRAALAGTVDIEMCLDLLTPGGGQTSYRDYLARFERDPASFYPDS